MCGTIMIWIVWTQYLNREWIHFVRCVSEARAIAEVLTILDLPIPRDALDIQTKRYDRSVKVAEIKNE